MNDFCCSQCGSARASGDLADQCPRCLGALAFGTFTDSPANVLHRAGDYEFLRELGRGGMGIVYEARQRSLNRRVAVKTLLTGAWARPDFKPRFRAEAEAAARLRHPGIVTIHEVGELDGQPFFAMELIAGPSLAELVRSQPLAPGRAARYVRLVAEAIAHAHAAGILHRDLKPSNVLLDDADQPRVTDFGLAKQLDSDTQLTRSGELMGSPSYLPPEQVAGKTVATTGDVYSLGAVLYQLLTARPPFVGETVAATLHQVLHSDPVAPRLLNAAVPPDLENICLKCLQKEPQQRYTSAAELAADLTRFAAGTPVKARPLSAFGRWILWCRRNPSLAVVSAALVVAVVTGLISVLAQWRRAEMSRTEMALNLYAADVAAASTALQQGNLGRARELLLPHAAKSTAGAATVAATPRSSATTPTEFTWRLLWSRCQGDALATLGEHPWIVTCVAVSPDGRWVASGSQDQPDNTTNSLKLWRLSDTTSSPTGETASPGRTLAATNAIWSVAFTEDSRTLISAGVNGVHFWDVKDGRARTDFPRLPGYEIALAGNILVGSPTPPFFSSTAPEPFWQMDLITHEVRLLTVRGRHPALSPDGRQLAFQDEDRNLQRIDLATERSLSTVATNHPVFRLRYSPDGQRLAAAGQLSAATVWDFHSPAAPPRLFPSDHTVWDAAFSPDGRTLITATSHQQLELWDALTGEPQGALAGHNNEVWTVATTPDGRQLVSGGKDRTVRLWSLEKRPPIPAVAQWRYARPQFSPDGSRLLTYAQTNGRGAATVWQLLPPQSRATPRVLPFPSATPAVSSNPTSPTVIVAKVGKLGGFPRGFAPDGISVLYARVDRPALEWWQVEPPRVIRTVELAHAPAVLFLGEFALAGDARSCVCAEATGEFWRWSTEDGRLLNRWTDAGLSAGIRLEFAGGKRPGRLLRALAASDTGRWLALGPLGSAVGLLVDFDTGRTVGLRGHHDDLATLAFAPSGDLLASGSVDGTIRLWTVPDGHPAGILPGHLESVESVAFTPDGQTLASVNPGIEVTFWHLPTRRELGHLRHPEAGYYLAFSPDGRRLALSATAGNLPTETDRVELWDAP